MLTLYLITAVVGGAFVLLSAIGGSHDHDVDADADFDAEADFDSDFEADVVDVDTDFDADADADFDADADADFDADADAHFDGDIHGHDVDHGELVHADVWLPFLSMRFWTYFLAFFGITGLLLTWLWQEGVSTAVLSSGMGLLCGLGMAYGTRYFKRSTTHSGVGADDIVGSEGEVVVPVSPGEVGKIRVFLKGADIDLIAKSDDKTRLERGSRVLVIGFEGATARIVRMAYASGEAEDDAEVEVEEEAEETATKDR